MRTSAGASTPGRTWLPRTSRTRTVTLSPTRITSPNFRVRTSILAPPHGLSAGGAPRFSGGLVQAEGGEACVLPLEPARHEERPPERAEPGAEPRAALGREARQDRDHVRRPGTAARRRLADELAPAGGQACELALEPLALGQREEDGRGAERDERLPLRAEYPDERLARPRLLLEHAEECVDLVHPSALA